MHIRVCCVSVTVYVCVLCVCDHACARARVCLCARTSWAPGSVLMSPHWSSPAPGTCDHHWAYKGGLGRGGDAEACSGTLPFLELRAAVRKNSGPHGAPDKAPTIQYSTDY